MSQKILLWTQLDFESAIDKINCYQKKNYKKKQKKKKKKLLDYNDDLFKAAKASER